MTEQIDDAVRKAVQESFAKVKIPERQTYRFGMIERVLLMLDKSGRLHWRYCLWRIAHRKFTWRCTRVGGGAALVTPRKMTKEKACRWLLRNTGGEIIFVDEDHKFIFYQTRAS